MIKMYSAEWCTSCKSMKQTLEGVSGFEEINVDYEPQDVKELGIKSIPTFIKYQDGNEIDRKVGTMTKHAFITWRDE